MRKQYSIGVIGHTGVVGSVVFDYYSKLGYPTLGISADKKGLLPHSTWEEVNKTCNIIFICVPTPYDYDNRRPNLSIIEDVMDKISDSKIVVIKSTVIPGTTDRLQIKYPNLRIVFNPEFLSRTTAKEDFLKPDRQLIGYTNISKISAQTVLNILPVGKYNKIINAKEAELVKYAHNIYGALRIIYANHLYDISQKIGADYNEVRTAFAASEFIGPGVLRYMNIFHNNKRGYGGPCFPKDVNSFISFCRQENINIELLEALRSANKRILKSQGLDEKKSESY